MQPLKRAPASPRIVETIERPITKSYTICFISKEHEKLMTSNRDTFVISLTVVYYLVIIVVNGSFSNVLY